MSQTTRVSVAGIDLGTTYTAAAVADVGGRPEIVTLGNRAASIPSAVHLADGAYVVGDSAERRATTDPRGLGRGFKRRMGDSTPILLAGTPVSPEALTARLLEHTMVTVTERLGRTPELVVLTHPANWGEFKIDTLRSAARMAGVHRVVTLAEPLAAAIWYAENNRLQTGEKVLVYDLGGGTFDAGVLERTDDGFRPVGAPEGIDRLGGIDIDEIVVAQVIASLGEDAEALLGSDESAAALLGTLRTACVEAKEVLSEEIATDVVVNLPGLPRAIRVTRAEVEARLRPLLAETIGAVERAIASAGCSADDLASILLVGGSSRIPLVAELLAAELGRPVKVDTDPKLAIALGAASFGLRELADAAPAPAAVPPAPPAPAAYSAAPATPAAHSAAPATPEQPATAPPNTSPAPPAAPPARVAAPAHLVDPAGPVAPSTPPPAATPAPRAAASGVVPPTPPSGSPQQTRSIGRLVGIGVAALVAIGAIVGGILLLGQEPAFGEVSVSIEDDGECRVDYAADDWSAGDTVVFVSADGTVLATLEEGSGWWATDQEVAEIRHNSGGEILGSTEISGC